jgi:hypothetical protein
MTRKELSRRLKAGRIVPLSVAAWTAVAGEFEQVERHDTLIAGDLLIVRTDAGLAAVEQPNSGERVVRQLGSVREAKAFVQQRLDLYERMWDGCGCKVDYYG